SPFSKPATLPELGEQGAPILDPFYFGQEGETRESRIGPSFVFNTVDNPYTPRAGQRLTMGVNFAGGPLGGQLDYVKPTVEGIVYFPHLRKTALGVRAMASYI